MRQHYLASNCFKFYINVCVCRRICHSAYMQRSENNIGKKLLSPSTTWKLRLPGSERQAHLPDKPFCHYHCPQQNSIKPGFSTWKKAYPPKQMKQHTLILKSKRKKKLKTTRKMTKLIPHRMQDHYLIDSELLMDR